MEDATVESLYREGSEFTNYHLPSLLPMLHLAKQASSCQLKRIKRVCFKSGITAIASPNH